MAHTPQELEAAVFDLAGRVATVRAASSAAITNDVDAADRLDVLEGCYRVLGDAMDSTWTAWERFDQGEMRAGAAPKEPPPKTKITSSALLQPQLPEQLGEPQTAAQMQHTPCASLRYLSSQRRSAATHVFSWVNSIVPSPSSSASRRC